MRGRILSKVTRAKRKTLRNESTHMTHVHINMYTYSRVLYSWSDSTLHCKTSTHYSPKHTFRGLCLHLNTLHLTRDQHGNIADGNEPTMKANLIRVASKTIRQPLAFRIPQSAPGPRNMQGLQSTYIHRPYPVHYF